MAARKTHNCPQCERTLKRDAFGNDKTRPGGRYRICKECDHSNQKAWRERKAAAKKSDDANARTSRRAVARAS